jgi:predicted negative regulator of RcsB-dependent stress response
MGHYDSSNWGKLSGIFILRNHLKALQITEDRFYEAEVYRLKGELLLQQSAAQQGEAEESLQQALEIARRQQAKCSVSELVS